MRLSLTGLVVATIATLVPMFALAGNQEVAQQIARNMRTSGRLSDYKIGVKFQDGTAWLTGRVRDEEQMNTALKVTISTPGVDRVVNSLAIGPGEPAAPEQSGMPAAAPQGPPPTNEPVSQVSTPGNEPPAQAPASPSTGRAEKVAITFTPSPARQVSAVEPTLVPIQDGPQPMPMATAPTAAPRHARIAYRQPAAQPPQQPQATNGVPGPPLPMYAPGTGGSVAPVRYDRPCMPNYAWPSYAAYPNYAGVTYPVQYSPTAWPYIGPFYPYPQVPLGWRKVTLEWDNGWWFLDFKDRPSSWESPIGRWY